MTTHSLDPASFSGDTTGRGTTGASFTFRAFRAILVLLVLLALPVESRSADHGAIIAAGRNHSLAIQGDGTVRAWGYNDYGQLGNGSMTSSATPVQVSGLTGVIALAAGGYHSLALKSDGTVWAWGANEDCELGDGSTKKNSATPVQVSGLTGVIAVAAGSYHSLALKSDGTVWAWGDNAYGQLGNGSMKANSATPVQVSGLTGVTAVAAGYAHSLALKGDGTVRAWGKNPSGHLGNGSTKDSSSPVQVSGLTGVIALAAGYGHSLALKGDGTVRAWGANYIGQLGNGSTKRQSTTPVQVPALSGIIAVGSGGFHSLALKGDGTILVWGDNKNAQLGNGSTKADSATPVQVSGLTGVTAVAGGGDHSLALKGDGTVWAWGANEYGELGNSSMKSSSSPVQVAP